tara:strand:+ start:587 stop:709 length:123 start_codon:yes stop_codon:yes gene_type:complete
MKTNKNEKDSPDPYEEMVRLEQLVPYKALIKPNNFLRKNN